MKTKLGDVVNVVFRDHSCTLGGGLSEPITINAYGIVKRITEEYITLVTWEVEGEESLEVTPNREGCAILRSCIIKTRVLK